MIFNLQIQALTPAFEADAKREIRRVLHSLAGSLYGDVRSGYLLDKRGHICGTFKLEAAPAPVRAISYEDRVRGFELEC